MLILAIAFCGVAFLIMSIVAFEVVRKHPISPEGKSQERAIKEQLEGGNN